MGIKLTPARKGTTIPEIIDDMNRAQVLLGQFVDTSIKSRPHRVLLGVEFYCLFCGDVGKSPDGVRHKHKCLVARAKDHLAKYGPH